MIQCHLTELYVNFVLKKSEYSDVKSVHIKHKSPNLKSYFPNLCFKLFVFEFITQRHILSQYFYNVTFKVLFKQKYCTFRLTYFLFHRTTFKENKSTKVCFSISLVIYMKFIAVYDFVCMGFFLRPM